MSATVLDPVEDVRFFTPDFLQNPHAFLENCREHSPVVRLTPTVEHKVEYLVTTYPLVQYVLNHPELFSSNYLPLLTGGGCVGPEVEAIRAQGFEEVDSVLTADDDVHKRLRGLISFAFVPARIRAMEASLIKVVDGLIDGFAKRGECDFVRDFAAWLPTNALAILMGIEDGQYADMQGWSAAITRRFGQMATLEQRIADERTILEAKRFMVDLIAERRRKPGSDLVSDLIAARDEDANKLSEFEILATIFILLVGATETTFSTLLFATAHLAQHPEMAYRLREDRSQIPAFVEEVLRYYTPVAGMWRIVRQDTDLGNARLAKGSLLMVRLDSANRDPTMFSEPDSFDIDRKGNIRHLSFGGGAHSCLGFRLAKMELNIAVNALLDRLDNFQIVEDESDLSILPSTHSRCIRSLKLCFSARTI